jgi:hypothetical protein
MLPVAGRKMVRATFAMITGLILLENPVGRRYFILN